MFLRFSRKILFIYLSIYPFNLHLSFIIAFVRLESNVKKKYSNNRAHFSSQLYKHRLMYVVLRQKKNRSRSTSNLRDLSFLRCFYHYAEILFLSEEEKHAKEIFLKSQLLLGFYASWNEGNRGQRGKGKKNSSPICSCSTKEVT